MIDERANDLFWSQMAFLKEENARQRRQNEQLLARLENERKPLKGQIRHCSIQSTSLLGKLPRAIRIQDFFRLP